MIRLIAGLAIAASLFGAAAAASAQTVSVYGGGQSQGVALGASGELFVTNFTGDAVSLIPSGGGAATTYVANQIQSPLDVFHSPTGDIYVTYELGGRVVRYDAGCLTPCTGTVVGTPSAPTWTTMNAAGQLFVASFNLRQITRYPANCIAPCTPTVFATGLAFGIAGMAVDAADNLYVVSADGSVLRFAAGCTTPCTPSVYASGLSTGIRGITVGEGGSFYLTDTTTRSILRLPNGGGAAAVYAALPVGAVPRDLDRAADGTIYVAGENAVYAISAPAPAPVPTLSEWAMILFGLTLAGGAALYLQTRAAVA